MKNKVITFVFSVVLLALGVPAEAQQSGKVARIGYLSRDLHPADSRALAPRNLEAFRQGLQELSYIEGKNIIIEYRYAEGRQERLPALAEELVRLKVEIIVAESFTTVRAVRKVTTTIPIVVTGGMDPVGSGFVASLSRPGGNVTGLSNYSVELLGKRLELLKEVVPKVSRFVFLNDTDSAPSKAMFKEAQVAAQTLGVKFQLVEVKAQDPDIDGAFRVMEGAHWRRHYVPKPPPQFKSSPEKDFAAIGAGSYASHAPFRRVGRSWRTYVLCGEHP